MEGILYIKEDWSKEPEIRITDGYEFQDENGNIINTKKITLVKKKPKYPTTYKECCKMLGCRPIVGFAGLGDEEENLYGKFIALKRCRDAYWKIAGEEMGLGKPWEPDWCDYITKYCIIYSPQYRGVCKRQYDGIKRILAFPTKEMRDTFYENFKELIESCKELL